MGRAPCCDKANVKKGPWSPEEDAKLKDFIEKFGTGGNWIALPQKAGLKRCGKSCRLRWLNYLRPNIKHGEFSDDEDRIICSLYANIGSRWSIIAAQLPGRTDNDIKNYWNTKLKKKLMGMIPLGADQRKLPPFSSHSFQTTNSSSPQSQAFSSLSQLYSDCSPYKNSYCLNGFEPFSSSIQPTTNLLYNNVNPMTNHQYSYNNLQDQGLTSPMQFYPGKDNMLMFGSGADNNQASCSSSDGSCGQISYGNIKEIKQEINMNNLHQAGYNSNLSSHQENQKFMLEYGNHQISPSTTTWGDNHHDQKPSISTNANFQLQYDLEEVKQLINSSSNMGMGMGMGMGLLVNDEIKTQHEMMISRGSAPQVYYYNY